MGAAGDGADEGEEGDKKTRIKHQGSEAAAIFVFIRHLLPGSPVRRMPSARIVSSLEMRCVSLKRE